MTGFPNWFAQYADRFFAEHLAQLAGNPGLRFLQIGAYTGDATCWLLEHVLTGEGCKLIDVDTWEGSEEHTGMDFAEVEKIYDTRTSDLGRIKFKGSSAEFFAVDPYLLGTFDFIYVDGDHTAPTVLSDAVRSWQLLKPGGLLAFDDYQWHSGLGPTHDPALAIDAFLAVHADQLEVIETGLQVWVRKQ